MDYEFIGSGKILSGGDKALRGVEARWNAVFIGNGVTVFQHRMVCGCGFLHPLSFSKRTAKPKLRFAVFQWIARCFTCLRVGRNCMECIVRAKFERLTLQLMSCEVGSRGGEN